MITKKQMLDFIFSQPKERVLDMREPLLNSECGCLGVQYALANLVKGDVSPGDGCSLGAVMFGDVTEHSEYLFESYVGSWGGVHSYEDVQNHCRKVFPNDCP